MPTSRGIHLPFDVGLVAPALTIIVVALVAPIAWVLYLSFFADQGHFSVQSYMTVLGSTLELKAFLTTLRLSASTLALCILLGVPYALAMTLVGRRVATALMFAVTLPFWTALLVRTFTWLIILQRHGLASSAFESLHPSAESISFVNNLAGTLIGMTHIMLPIFILPTYAAMRSVDPALIRAAISLGATRLVAIRGILLPLSMRGILSGATLVFVTSLGFYVTPALLGGGKVNVLSGRIERNITAYDDWGAASALGVLLFLLVGAVLIAARFVLVRSGRPGGPDNE